MSNIYKARRKKLSEMVENNTLIIIFSGGELVRNSDINYPFRQDSQFYYYTGIKEPEAVCFIYKDFKGEINELLFSKKNTKLDITWHGYRDTFEDMNDQSSISKILDIKEFESYTYNFFENNNIDYFSCNNSNLNLRQSIVNHITHKADRYGYDQVSHFIKLEYFSSKQRFIKDSSEIDSIKKAISISKKAMAFAFQNAVASKSSFENNIISDLYKIYRDNNVTWAYPAIVAKGENATIMHYIEGSDKIKDTDLVLVDAGCEYNFYSSDITRCFPKCGKFSKAQKEIYNIVLNANKNVISALRKGQKTYKDLELECSKSLISGMIELGILTGTIEDNLKSKKYREYYPHGFGHSLGLDTHDLTYCLNNFKGLRDYVLHQGAVTTVEPGLYFSKDDKNIPSQYRGLGIRIEDNVLITKEGVEVLTAEIPKEIQEVENWINSK